MGDSLKFDSYDPDFDHNCIVCGQNPVVTLVRKGEVVYETEMCGPCTFGTAKALDWDWWNTQDD